MAGSNFSRRLRKSKELKKSIRDSNQAIATLSKEEQDVRNQISELERYIVEAPERATTARREQLDEMRTLPPPDELAGQRYRLNVTTTSEFPRLMRRHEAAIRRQRLRNLLTFLVVSLLVAVFALWLGETL
jgi:septal ring factor EnvC (AmiA/AmiB activator)